ncbi:MAG: hypothetical protein OXK80_02795 [Bdellovibrionales bacterium]|nr:hypothetical protein [Bdellovibrionales bacterium]
MKVNCHFQDSSSFTVGEVRLLKCRGDIPPFSSSVKTEFQDKSKKYALHILETVSIQDQDITLKVTGYQTGQYKDSILKLTDGQHSVNIEGLSWQVPSVLTSETGPHPPYGPWKIKVPLWYELSWGFLFLVILIFGIFRFKKHRLKTLIRQRVADRLEEKTPVQYFIRQLSSLFSLEKNSETFLVQLQKSFRAFLENQFEIPLEEPVHKVLKHKSIDKKARQIISELETALKVQDSYSEQDGEQLLNMVRSWIFQFNKKTSPMDKPKEEID